MPYRILSSGKVIRNFAALFLSYHKAAKKSRTFSGKLRLFHAPEQASRYDTEQKSCKMAFAKFPPCWSKHQFTLFIFVELSVQQVIVPIFQENKLDILGGLCYNI
ncbi:MAG: hypothetical protein ACLR5S_05530 [Ruminococcus sp.]